MSHGIRHPAAAATISRSPTSNSLSPTSIAVPVTYPLCGNPRLPVLLPSALQIVWGLPPNSAVPEPPPGCRCRVVTLEAVEALGRRHPRAHVPPKPSEIATLCYTSGTTGQPKGGCAGRCG